MPNDARLSRAVRQRLESLYRAGVTDLERKALTAAIGKMRRTAIEKRRSQVQEQASLESSRPRPTPSTELSEPKEIMSAAKSTPRRTAKSCAERLAAVQQEVAACTRCDELASTRTQTVFGVGNPRAKICFLGEAPGADEDKQGEPFVGRAGKLLTRIIESCTLKREDVYILNTLKCRPPKNRNPLPQESANCREYLERQLEIIQPKFICCLGAVAAKALLKVETPIGRLRGKFHKYQGIQVVCTYHPAYLLRNPSAKRDVWNDMKMLMRELGVELS